MDKVERRNIVPSVGFSCSRVREDAVILTGPEDKLTNERPRPYRRMIAFVAAALIIVFALAG